jgi:phosphatidylserine/phosphatidylglycerophosphate/cardiolipin synthase-like enzyme
MPRAGEPPRPRIAQAAGGRRAGVTPAPVDPRRWCPLSGPRAIRYRYDVLVFEIHFGGPDRPRGCLRDLLAERVEAVPPGGAIDWVTYYFRDRRLAAALLRASDRGVQVRVTLDGRPRTPRANEAVVHMLRRGLNGGLRVVSHPMDAAPWGKLVRPRLHEKLYCFSHPEPVAFIGSFNPSGDDPEEDPEVLEEIGDQDRGHNLLVGLRDRPLVDGLVEHARGLHGRRHGAFERFRPASNRELRSDGLSIHFRPRVRRDPVYALLQRCGAEHRVRIAASHLSGPTSVGVLRSLAARGAAVEILAEATLRRVPPQAEQRLRAVGVSIRRVVHPDGLPMHAKFALIDGRGERRVVFGSFNWTEPSLRFNREIGVIASDPRLFGSFEARWEVLRDGCVESPGH